MRTMLIVFYPVSAIVVEPKSPEYVIRYSPHIRHDEEVPPQLVVLHEIQDFSPLADVRVELVLKVLPSSGSVLQVQLCGPESLDSRFSRTRRVAVS